MYVARSASSVLLLHVGVELLAQVCGQCVYKVVNLI
jgi:hypothetical protein